MGGNRPSSCVHRIGRRDALKGAGALGVAGLAMPWLSAARALAGSGGLSGGIPIKHVVVDMQENRSFDHYYGFAPFAGAYGVPSGYSQPDGSGGLVKPYHFTNPSTPDIGHSWGAIDAEFHGRKMDALYTTPPTTRLSPPTPSRPPP